MEGLAALIFLMVVGLLAAPVMALIALIRVGRVRDVTRRLTELEGAQVGIDARLNTLRRRIDSLRAPADPAVADAGAEPAAKPAPAPSPQTPPAPGIASDAAPVREPTPPPARPASPAAGSAASPAPPPRAYRTPVAPPPTPASRPAVAIEWERWIGIRGAAVLGAAALGLAGLLFFKYSVEHGLITPSMRVVLGTLVGLGCLVASGWLRKREYAYTADGLAGAGVVILYAAFWAAHTLYGLIGMPTSFGLMVLVTVACCVLAVRNASMVTAVIGLVGGFATPLLLSSGTDRPIGLFGYVLLLDLGLLAVGHKRRWPSLGVLSLLGTVLLEALWIGNRMGPDRLFLGLAILVVFSVLFAFSGRLGRAEDSAGAWLWSRLGGIAFPFAFALYFAARVELGPRLYPIAILLALLCLAAAYIAREQATYPVATGAAVASLAVIAVWLLQHSLTLSLAWETAIVVVGLAAIFHLFVELESVPAGLEGPAPAAQIAAAGAFLLLFYAAATAEMTIWPSLVALIALVALLYRHAAFPDRGILQPAAAIGLGLGISILHLFERATLPPHGLYLGLIVLACVVLHALAVSRRQPDLRRMALHAAAVLPVILLVGLAPSRMVYSLSALPALGTALVLGIATLLAATRLFSGNWYVSAVLATLFVHWTWTISRTSLHEGVAGPWIAFLIQLLTVVVFTLWPLFNVERFKGRPLVLYCAALAAPLWFLPLKALFEINFGETWIGALPVLLGALVLGAAYRSRDLFAETDPRRKSALAWFSAVALCFLAVAVPLQLDREWVTIGWALQGLAVTALWKRLDHPGLKYFALALLGMATVRLVANPALLGYYPRSSVRIVNWLMYTYLVPAAALLGSGSLLRPFESLRARPGERGLYASGHPIGATATGLAAIAVVFVWINLTIVDWYATGSSLSLNFGGPPAQRLAVSIAWAVYALVLLGFGVGRSSIGLRWISLGFLLVTIGKVFLYDLGSLKDLYRVASLVGLAVSLILVSLLYQRFVFRSSAGKPG